MSAALGRLTKYAREWRALAFAYRVEKLAGRIWAASAWRSTRQRLSCCGPGGARPGSGTSMLHRMVWNSWQLNRRSITCVAPRLTAALFLTLPVLRSVLCPRPVGSRPLEATHRTPGANGRRKQCLCTLLVSRSLLRCRRQRTSRRAANVQGSMLVPALPVWARGRG
jgi:hypothetical protein